MEKDIIFLRIRETYSKKKDKTYYIIEYIQDKEHITEFITEEMYAQLKVTKLEFLGKYKGIYDINPFNRKLQLINIKQ